MMCIFWTVVALALIGVSITTWAVFRIYVLASEHDYPDIQEEVPYDDRM